MKFVESFELRAEEIIDKRRFSLIDRLFLRVKHVARIKGARRELHIRYRGEKDGFLYFDLLETNSTTLVTDDLGFLSVPLNGDGIPMIDEDGKPLPCVHGNGNGRTRPIGDVDPKEWYGEAYPPLQEFLDVRLAMTTEQRIADARLKTVEVHFKDGSSKVMSVDEIADYERQKKLMTIPYP